MRTSAPALDTSVDRLLAVAAHKIATQYNLPDAHKLATPGAALVGRLASVYRKLAAGVDDGARYMFDAALIASQHSLTLLQAARGTRVDMPSAAHWALLMGALCSVVMSSAPAELSEVENFVQHLAADLAQL